MTLVDVQWTLKNLIILLDFYLFSLSIHNILCINLLKGLRPMYANIVKCKFILAIINFIKQSVLFQT
jgi:hypothetical protein